MFSAIRKVTAALAAFTLILSVAGCTRVAKQPPAPPLPPVQEPVPPAQAWLDHMTALYFADARTGWVAGYDGSYGSEAGRLLATSDGGRTWSDLAAPDGVALQVRFADAKHGWAVTELNPARGSYQNVAIFGTADGGRTWTRQWQGPFSDNLGNLMALMRVRISLFGGQTGYVQVGGQLLATRNGGGQWEALSPGKGFVPTDVSFADAETGWVAGQRGGGLGNAAPQPVVMATQDGGRTWNQVFAADGSDGSGSGYLAGSAGIAFADRQHGWLYFKGIDLNGRLYQTNDGGQHWTREQSSLAGGRTVAGAPTFVDPTTGWLPQAAGAAPFPGGLYRTRNGGRNWTFTGGERNWSINGISLVSPTTGWAIGTQLDTQQDFLINTADGGDSWQQVLPALSPAGGLSLLSSGAGFGTGLPSEPAAFLRTSDGGRTWQRAGSFRRSPLAISFIDDKHGWVLTGSLASGERDLLATSDAGGTWTSLAKFPGGAGASGPSQPYLRFFDARNGLLQTQDWPQVALAVTTDGGRTWQQQFSVAKAPGWAKLSFTSPSQGAMVMQTAGDTKTQPTASVMTTSDGGSTWTTVNQVRFDYQVEGLAFINATEGWMLVKHNPLTRNPTEELMHSTDGGQTWRTSPLPADTSSSLTDVAPEVMQMGFLDANRGWILARGRLLYTLDGGKTWTPRP